MRKLSELSKSWDYPLIVSAMRCAVLALMFTLPACSSFPLVQPTPAPAIVPVADELPVAETLPTPAPLPVVSTPLLYPPPIKNRLVDEKGNATSLTALPNG